MKKYSDSKEVKGVRICSRKQMILGSLDHKRTQKEKQYLTDLYLKHGINY